MLLATSLGATAGGWGAYQSDPVLNPGIVIVSNNTSYQVTFDVHAGGVAIDGSYWSMSNGQSWHSTKCCFAAGTEYYIVVRYQPQDGMKKKDKIYFRPRLCNRNGIPYGFTHLVLTDSSHHFVDGCYEGPLKQ